jgi:hypothetical protein
VNGKDEVKERIRKKKRSRREGKKQKVITARI